jgi:hypothetical protein
MKGILEYYDRDLRQEVRKDIEADTLQKCKKACERELDRKDYTEPALYVEDEKGEG